MKKLSKRLGLLSIMMVIMLMVVPTNVAAVTHVSHFETLDTSFFPMGAVASDNIAGFTNYGQPWNTINNHQDLRWPNVPFYQAGDDVIVHVDCTAINNGIGGGRSVNIFSLEVYPEHVWVNQGNPWYLDSWQIQLAPNQQAQNTLTINISVADCNNITIANWCVYYVCEVIDLDRVGPPPMWFLIDQDNYWIVLR